MFLTDSNTVITLSINRLEYYSIKTNITDYYSKKVLCQDIIKKGISNGTPSL